MKKIIDNPQHETDMQNQPCSEKKCATCFANRGCLYEQYPVIVTHAIERPYQDNHINNSIGQISKRA